MQILFDHGGLCLHVDDGGPLHAEALETWQEACALAKTSIDALPPSDAEDACRQLAETATHALTAGRDNRVIADFRRVERRIRDADETLRAAILKHAFEIFTYCLVAGFAAGIIWMWVEPFAPWNHLPRGLDLAANYLLLVLGWTGFTLVGFSLGWLFRICAAVRIQGRMDVVKQAVSLRQRNAHVAYNALVCLIIIIVMFFFGGFAQIDEALSAQMTSAPWAILLGLIAGVVESEVSERIRAFLKFS